MATSAAIPSPRRTRRSWLASLTWSSTISTRIGDSFRNRVGRAPRMGRPPVAVVLLGAFVLVVGVGVAGLIGVAAGAVVAGRLRAGGLARALGILLRALGAGRVRGLRRGLIAALDVVGVRCARLLRERGAGGLGLVGVTVRAVAAGGGLDARCLAGGARGRRRRGRLGGRAARLGQRGAAERQRDQRCETYGRLLDVLDHRVLLWVVGRQALCTVRGVDELTVTRAMGGEAAGAGSAGRG